MAEALADHTTLRLGGPARSWVRAVSEQELIDAVSAADAAGTEVLATIRRTRRDAMVTLVARLTPEEQATLHHLLTRLAQD